MTVRKRKYEWQDKKYSVSGRYSQEQREAGFIKG